MKKIIPISFVVLIFGFITFLFSFKSTHVIEIEIYEKIDTVRVVKIEIDTKKDQIILNGIQLDFRYDLLQIEQLIGKPSRILADTSTVYIEEFGYDGEQPHSYPQKVENQYYIYDELGLMFFTLNKGFGEKYVSTMLIKFEAKRLFTNTSKLNHEPKKSFSGKLSINSNNVSSKTKLIPERVNYRTEEFPLLGTSFGPTSIGGEIDRLYSIDAKPYLLFFLNNAIDQKISYLEVK